jgi:putative tryptophan/tyrosine transport system substrate-binding protein
MDRRTFVCSVAGGILAAPLGASAQQQRKTARVGFLVTSPRETQAPVFGTIVRRLHELGYVEGQNVIFEFRHADSEEGFRERATQLVGVGVHVIFAQGPYALQAARAATTTIPIVGIDNESDPIAAGYATSLAHPGGNVTGVFLDQSDVSAKQLQLLKEMVPGLTRVAVLWDPAVASAQREAVDDGARRLGVTVSPIAWRGPDALLEALRSATKDGARGLIVLSTPRILNPKDRPLVAAAALNIRLPAVGLTETFARDGLLIAYGPVQLDMYRSAATSIAKILDGARPADIPIERPTTFKFVINMKTAKALGLTIPPALLLQANEVLQ